MEHEKIIQSWKEFEIPEVKDREIEVVIKEDFITTISGPRRVGKTFLCFQKIKELLKKGIPKENILYINFEDEKLINADANDLDKLLNIYLEDLKKNNKNIFLFLDEIQTVKNWDSWVRRIHETNRKIRLVITGSSSKLLSREISTILRGRIYNIEVFPLNFKEYLSWKKKDLNLKSILNDGKDSILAKKYFKEYLDNGGYPVIFKNLELKTEVLQSYYDSMIFKDIIERYNVLDVKKLQILAKLIFESISKEISYTNLSNKLKSLGFSMGKSTIIDYISYFEEAYLFFQVLKYEYSLQKQLGSIKKVYCIDNGLLNSLTFSFSEDKGKLLENMIFVNLKSLKKEIYYNRGKNECDFVIKDKNKISEAIQVCYRLKDENRDREFKGLIEAMNKFNLKEGFIITFDQEETIKKDSLTIKVIPAYKWFLSL